MLKSLQYNRAHNHIRSRGRYVAKSVLPCLMMPAALPRFLLSEAEHEGIIRHDVRRRRRFPLRDSIVCRRALFAATLCHMHDARGVCLTRLIKIRLPILQPIHMFFSGYLHDSVEAPYFVAYFSHDSSRAARSGFFMLLIWPTLSQTRGDCR